MNLNFKRKAGVPLANKVWRNQYNDHELVWREGGLGKSFKYNAVKCFGVVIAGELLKSKAGLPNLYKSLDGAISAYEKATGNVICGVKR